MPKGFTCDQRIDEFKFRALKAKHGYEFYVGRIWRSTGKSDPTGIKNMRDALRAGFTEVSAYLFPRFTSPARPQVENALNFLKEAGVSVNILWLDVEDVEDPSVWSRDKQTNRQFIKDLVVQADTMGVKTGVYASLSSWEAIVGDWEGMHHHPLWWVSWMGEPSFYNFKPFGGWTTPTMRQYNGDVEGPFGLTIDESWKP